MVFYTSDWGYKYRIKILIKYFIGHSWSRREIESSPFWIHFPKNHEPVEIDWQKARNGLQRFPDTHVPIIFYDHQEKKWFLTDKIVHNEMLEVPQWFISFYTKQSGKGVR